MSSSSSSSSSNPQSTPSSSSSQQQQQQSRMRKPPLADWPTIKILTPPQGRFSPKTDEWCFTYCTQSISGRVHGKEPNCRTVCMRKVFPHEVRNILSFQRHQSVSQDGKAKYPLPDEGQSANLPRILGGTPPDMSDDTTRPSTPPPVNHWDEGWYLWAGQGFRNAVNRMQTMKMGLRTQQQFKAQNAKQAELWQEYQDYLKQHGPENSAEIAKTYGGKWWGPLVPQQPVPDMRSVCFIIRSPVSKSFLIPLPPPVPNMREKINKLMAPTYHVLSILQESITSGEQKQFVQRVWEKAGTEEPFILAKRTLNRAYEQWKKRDLTEEDDEKKGST
ncbi:hypothetical protein CVT24_007302 [Panaeolus cyanescens]|uniref:Uncharacterized protein n=1 Tax=Panaeolus cyanescens TaxID=181874 RepID=A0A409VJ84_9AGAR|nr:hypothetical protein CVT24_007302 [Panaeolus cyanescens]